MKSSARFSVLVFFAALLCFAPCAVGQGIAVAGNSVLNQAPTAFLTIGLGPGGLLGGDNNNGNCGGQGGSDGWDWFFGGRNKKDCKPPTAMPEGGASLMYLALAGLCCFGAIGYRLRRQASVARSN